MAPERGELLAVGHPKKRIWLNRRHMLFEKRTDYPNPSEYCNRTQNRNQPQSLNGLLSTHRERTNR